MTIEHAVSGDFDLRIGQARITQRVADCTDERRRIDIDEWRRKKLLVPGSWFTWYWTRGGKQVASIWVSVESDSLTLRYRLNRNASPPIDSRIQLAQIPQPFGGQRAYFLCSGCGRRACMLYANNLGRFTCRHCQHLAYRVQREEPLPRLFRRVEKIREKLGWTAGIANPSGGRPKWMRREGYFALLDVHTDLVRRIVGALSKS